MKIWFDMTNSPHVSFFKYMIEDLKKEGHEVIVTARPLGNTLQLLELNNINYTIVGKHYGKSNIKKVYGFIIRILQLCRFLKENRPDVAIAQASYYSPVVSRIMGIYSIYTNDNEHAKGNIPAFICANKIYIPEFLNKHKIGKAFAGKTSNYPGIKEGIYLWRYVENKSGKESLGNESEKKIYIRTEPSLAQYYSGDTFFLDEMILNLKEEFNIVIIPREPEQAKYYSQEKFSGVNVLKSPKFISEIALDCLFFVGAGGTMTREMAVLGVPTISIYNDELLSVDKYLVDSGFMVHVTSDFSNDVINYIRSFKNKSSTDKTLLNKGKSAYLLLKESIFKGK